MKSLKSILPVVIAASLATLLIGCGGSSSSGGNTTQPISVSLNHPPNSLATKATQAISATVLNDSKTAGVTWSVSCGSAGACGSFSASTSMSGANVTYTAPAAVPTGATVTVTATSVSDTTKTASTSISINAPTISVSLSTVPSTLGIKSTTPITATVANDSANGGVTWSCAPAGSCGSFSTGQTPSGNPVTYTAPASVPSSTVVITATSVTDTTKSASTPPVTITSALVVTLRPTLPSMAPSQSTAVIANVTNDPRNAGVTWSCVPSNACGSFNPHQTASGSPSMFTAPATSGNVSITATSVSDHTKQASATISVTNAASQTLAPGNYVFSASGVDANGGNPYSVSGVFTVSGPGVISGGEQDFVDAGYELYDTFMSSSYAFNSDGNLEITLNTGDTLIGPGSQANTGTGVEVFDVTLVSGTRGLLTEFDTWAASSGTLDLQATSSLATPSGSYAFYTAGFDSSVLPLVVGGVLNIDSANTISGNNSVFDMNDYGALYPASGFDTSSVSSPDALGRVTFTLNPNPASTVPSITLIGYIIDSSQIRLVESADNVGGTTGGSALAQTGAGNFSTSSISGSNYVFGTQGFDNVGALQIAGVLTANSDTTVGGALNFNDLASQNGQGGTAISAGTYAVDNTGRVTLAGLTDNLTFSYSLQLYLTGDGHALAISMDSSDAVAGFAFEQAAATFNAGAFAGNYAMNTTINTNNGLYFAGVGPIDADGVGALTGFVDLNEQNPPVFVPVPALPLSGTFTANPSGIFTGAITGIYTANTTAPMNFTYYVIDPAHAVAIETDANQETLGYLELQQ